MKKAPKTAKTVILDNYDSFTYNLYQLVGSLGGNPIVYRNDAVTAGEIRDMKPTHIVVSPGPGTPENKRDFGVCGEVIVELGKTIPLLGVCLGHQGIVHAFGGRIVRAPVPMHGKTCLVEHDGKGVFRGLKNPLKVMRYHSLMADPRALPPCLEVAASTKDELIMAVRHKEYPVYGIQFHPESVGTETGEKIMKNFLNMLGARVK